jgi:malonate-semialdehyde dehydrogenase (acetylating)/methylmalonate-semialdehyde dehydrogenase
MRSIMNFVDGRFEQGEGEEMYDVYNPAFGKKIATVRGATREEIDRAIDDASDAQKKWANVPISDRVKFLFKLENIMWNKIDEIAEVTTIEHGKTFEESKGDVIRAIQNVEAAAAASYHIMGRNNRGIAPDIDEELVRVPLGVFAVISPFNFPVMIPFWFFPYAVTLGNSVVIKPSEKTPMSMEMVMSLVKDSGYPDGVIQEINGGKEAVDYILENKNVKGISFVGSTPVADYVYKKGTSGGKRVQGGASAKNHILVMPDAKLDQSINNIIGSFYGNAGERCLAGSVLVTLPENHDKVLGIFKKKAESLRLGYGMEKTTDMGPLIRKEHLERVKKYIEIGEEEGGKLILDGRGKKVSDYPEGFFLGPSIIDEVTEGMTVAKEEIFGPVASFLTADSIEDAIEIINKSRYGNASAIYTTSGQYAKRFAEQVEVGNIGINVGVAAPIAFYPFSGMKESFFGDLHPQGGEDNAYFFTDRKVIISKW